MRRAQFAAAIIGAAALATGGAASALTLVPKMAPQPAPHSAPPAAPAPQRSAPPAATAPRHFDRFSPGYRPYYPHRHFFAPAPFFVPPPVYYPPPPVYYAPPPVVYAPPVYYPPPPTQYIERDDGYWYFCAPLDAYYPDVTQCPDPWQRVPQASQ